MAKNESGKLQKSIAEFIVNRPKSVLIFSMLLLSMIGFGIKDLQEDFSYRVWFYEDDPLLQSFDTFERKFGSDEVLAVSIHSTSGIFDKESVKMVQTITDKMWHVPQVIRVESLSNFNWIRSKDDEIIIAPLLPSDEELDQRELDRRKKIALNHETLSNYLVSADGKTALVTAFLKPSLKTSLQYPPVVEGLKSLISSIKDSGDHSFEISGTPVLNLSYKETATADFAKLMPIVFVLVATLMFAFTRRAVSVFLPFVATILAIVCAFGFGGYFGMKMNNVTAILPQMLLAVGIANSVHIMVSFFQYRNNDKEKKASAIYALSKNLRPTFLTSITTAIGFVSFSFSAIRPISHVGYLGAFGTIAAWFVTYSIIGPLLVLLPSSSKKVKKPNKRVDDLSYSIVSKISNNRLLIFAFFAIACFGGVILAVRTPINANPYEYFPKTSPIRVATDFIEEHIGGIWGPEIVISSGKTDGIKDPAFMAKVDQLQTWIDTLPTVTKTVSLTNILKQMNRSLHSDDQRFYVLPDSKDAISQMIFMYSLNLPQGMDLNNRMTTKQDALRLSVYWKLRGSKESLEVYDKIETYAKQLGLQIYITGKNKLFQSLDLRIAKTFTVSILLAMTLVSILLGLTYRSPKMMLLAMIPNIIPLIIGGAAIYLMGLTLDIGTVTVAAICLGICVDDTIHFLDNFISYQRKGYTNESGIVEVFKHTAPALLITTTVLVIGFGVFAFAGFVPNVNFGKLSAIIFSVALFTDLVLLPAILMKAKLKASTLGQANDRAEKGVFDQAVEF